MTQEDISTCNVFLIENQILYLKIKFPETHFPTCKANAQHPCSANCLFFLKTLPIPLANFHLTTRNSGRKTYKCAVLLFIVANGY